MQNNPYSTRSGRNPWVIVGWLLLIFALIGVYTNQAKAATLTNGEVHPLVSDAWLIHHGIETSQWKDAACKARALELVDETKLTQARLDEALRLALNASNEECDEQDTTPANPGPTAAELMSRLLPVNEEPIQAIQAGYNTARWIDETCSVVAYELANFSPDEPNSTLRKHAARALVDRAATARNCRIENGQVLVDVGSFSEAPNACRSQLTLDPDEEPVITRLCPRTNW